MKAVRYLYEGKHKDMVKKLILLAPFDKKALMKAFSKTPLSELISKAEQIVHEGSGDEIISEEFDSIQVSYKTYLSWYK